MTKDLDRDGFKAAVIHGNKSQNARQKALNDFRDGSVRILVATDIAARGIDVPGISHAACHLLTVVCPFPITGAAVAEDDSRVDFDIPDAGFSKEDVTARLMELVRADHPIFTRLITDEELAANPGLVKSKNVRPPVGTGRIRLVCIGDNASIDSQPCGGTHVKSTGEIGQIHIGKIEKKGRENRRFRIRFGPLPAQ